MEFPEQMTDIRRKSESNSGSGRGGAGRGGLVHLRNREEERNANVDPPLRISERFQDLFNPNNRDSHT